MTLNICNKVWQLLIWNVESVFIANIQLHITHYLCDLGQVIKYFFFLKLSGSIITIMSTSLALPSACLSISAGFQLTWLTDFPLSLIYQFHKFHLPCMPVTQYLHIFWDMPSFHFGLVEYYNFKLFSVSFMDVWYLLDYIPYFLKYIPSTTRVNTLFRHIWVLNSTVYLSSRKAEVKETVWCP